MKFNGLVLYSPTPEEAQLLRDILDIHLKTRPDMKEISKRNSKKKFFSTEYNFADINREVNNLSLGWKWEPLNLVSKKETFILSRRGGRTHSVMLLLCLVLTQSAILPQHKQSRL